MVEFFKYMARTGEISLNAKNQTVDYTRHSKDHAFVNGLGGLSKRDIETVTVTTKDGMKYEIPVDKRTGRVPTEYLYAHFLNPAVGSKTGRERNILLDIGIDAEELIEIPKGGFTPKQLVESGWWQSVNTRDILGIDDAGAAAFAMEIEDAAKSAKGAGRKMVLLMPEDSAERVRSILAKDFNATELKKAVKNGGIIIKEGNPGRGAAGCYIARQEDMSLKTPVIILGPGWNEETLAHEFLHHLRHVDDTRDALTRSPYPFREDGERRSMRYMPESERNSLSNLEEAATVAESLVRIQAPSDGANGYYATTHSHGDSPMARYNYDRKILAGDGPRRGRKAEKKTKDEFRNTSISHMGAARPGSNAINKYDQLQRDGKLPKGKKTAKKSTAKKKAASPTDIVTTGQGPVVANANRKYTRAKR